MKQITSLVLISALALALLAGRVHAQINSPPPTLGGQKSYHLYSVPGVIAGVGGLGTFFACTNVTSGTIRVGVELFGPGGGAAFDDPDATSLEINPGGTLIFGTGGAAGIAIDSNLGGAASKASARILATKSSGIICSAFIADASNEPTTSMVKLTVVKNKTQKGE